MQMQTNLADSKMYLEEKKVKSFPSEREKQVVLFALPTFSIC